MCSFWYHKAMQITGVKLATSVICLSASGKKRVKRRLCFYHSESTHWFLDFSTINLSFEQRKKLTQLDVGSCDHRKLARTLWNRGSVGGRCRPKQIFHFVLSTLFKKLDRENANKILFQRIKKTKRCYLVSLLLNWVFIRCWGICSLTREENVATIGRLHTSSLNWALLFSDYCEIPKVTIQECPLNKHPKVGEILWRVSSEAPLSDAGATSDRVYVSLTPNAVVFQMDDSKKTKWCSSLVPPPAYLNLSPPQAMLSWTSPFEHKWLDNDLHRSSCRILKPNKSLLYPMAVAYICPLLETVAALGVTHSWASNWIPAINHNDLDRSAPGVL